MRLKSGLVLQSSSSNIPAAKTFAHSTHSWTAAWKATSTTTSFVTFRYESEMITGVCMVIVACIDPLSLCGLQYIKMLTRTLCHNHCSVLKILKPLLYNSCTFILPRAHLCSCVPCCTVNVSISLYGGLCLLLCIVRCMHGESDFYQYAW